MAENSQIKSMKMISAIHLCLPSMKRISLSLCMVFLIAPWAKVYGNQPLFTFTTNNDGTLAVSGYNGTPPANLTIPTNFSTNAVTAIGTNAFTGMTNITNLIVPDGIVDIRSNAFLQCSNLAAVTIGDTVTNVGLASFEDCTALTTVSLGTNLQNIGTSAFQSAGLTSLVIPNSTTNIGSLAFFSCTALTNVTIGTGVVNLGNSAFQNSGLTSVVIPDSVTNIGGAAFENCTAITNVTMGTNVTVIGSAAFAANTHLAGLTIPPSVTVIGGQAFVVCLDLTNIVIPASVTTVGDQAFGDCPSLTNISVATNNPALTSVGGVLFDINEKSLLAYPDGNPATAYTVPGTVTNIEGNAFYQALHLQEVNLPNGLLNIGGQAFDQAALTNIVIPDSVTNIGGTTFYGNPLSSVTIGQGLKMLSSRLFLGCPLNSVVIPNALQQIGVQAFQGCGDLTNVIIGSGVTYIASTAFQNCNTLTNIDFLGNAPSPTNDTTVFPTNISATIYYLPSATGWGPTFDGLPTVELAGSATVTIAPAGVLSLGAQWQVDSGALQNSGATVSNISLGAHTISFSTVAGWTTPASQPITVTIGSTTNLTNTYVQQFGNLQVTLAPAGAITAGAQWTLDGGAPMASGVTISNLPASFTHTVAFQEIPGWTTPASQTFTVSNNVTTQITGNYIVFPTNFLTTGEGNYYGLFAPTNGPRPQDRSGAIKLTVAKKGAFSGQLQVGSETLRFSGKFNTNGAVITNITSHVAPVITLTLQLYPSDQSIFGTISNEDFVADVTAYQAVYNTHSKAPFAGHFTLVIPGATNAETGPFGTSYASVAVNSSGAITIAGSLADGTALSQSSQAVAGGYWPLYVPLYGGKGSIWGWNLFTNDGIISLPPYASWINPTNSSKTAAYRSGFTNDSAVLSGQYYNPAASPLLDLTSGTAVLSGAGLTNSITNSFTLSSTGLIKFTNIVANSNKLTLTITKNTGAISGTFVSPPTSHTKIKVNGVLLQGSTNAEGYFILDGESGTLELSAP